MAGNPVASINAQLGLDSAQFQDGLGKARTKLQKFAKEAEDAGRINFGGAIEKIFDSSRLVVLDEGAARLNVFGSALEALGPAGVAGAAGIAATALAFGVLKKAAEEIGALALDSKKLGIPVEDLQRWQFIAAASHVSNQELDTSFQGLSVTLDRLKSGIRDARLRPFMDELKISDADLSKVSNAAELLQLLSQRMNALNVSQPERLDIAKAFGGDGAINILSRSSDELARLTDEYHRNAGVVSGEQAEAVERSNQKFEEAHAIMQSQIRKDLTDLAPLVGKLGLAWDYVTDAVLRTVKAQAEMFGHPISTVQQLFGFKGGWGAIGKPLPSNEPAASAKGKAAPPAGPTAAAIERQQNAQEDIAGALEEDVTHTKRATEMAKRIAKDRAEGAIITAAQEKALMAAARAQDAKPATRAASEAERKAAEAARKAQEAAQRELEKQDRSNDLVDDATDRELSARRALAVNVEDQAKLENQVTEALRKKSVDKINEQIREGKVDPGKGAEAVGLINQAASETTERTNRATGDQLAAQAGAATRATIERQIELEQAQGALAVTVKDRHASDLRVIALQDQLERSQLEEIIASKGVSDADKKAAQAKLDALPKLTASKVAVSDKGAQGAGGDYRDSMANDIATAGDSIKVDGLRSLTDNLTGVVTGAKSAKDAIHDMAQSIIADIVRIGVEREITLPLANALFPTAGASGAPSAQSGGNWLAAAASVAKFIPGFATGTDDAPGGTALVGEAGPELVNLPRHSSVTPHSLIGSVGASKAADSGPTFVLHSPVVTQDLIDQMNAIGARSTAHAVAISNSTIRGVVKTTSFDQNVNP